jgi:CubicO group peptidase (beta-lactamase class C family)
MNTNTSSFCRALSVRVAGASVFFVVTAAVFLGTASPVASAVPETDGYSRIDAYVRSTMDASGIPGVAYGLVRDGKVVHLAAFGVADSSGRSMTARTPLVIGSTGKTITALAIRQLIEAGKLDSAAPVRRYLPWFAMATSSAADSITIESLLRHTSGISTAAGQNPTYYEPGLTPEGVVRLLRDVPLDGRAGTYEYSNLNYVILGVVVEAVSGQRYEAYLRDHVFGPLEMRHSYASLEPARADGLAQGHRYLFGQPVGFEEPYPTGIVPAGYQISTAEDMAHYVAALSHHGRYQAIDIVGASSAIEDQDYGIDWAPSTGFGAGYTPGHSGTTLGTNTAIMYTPGSHVGVVVLANANPTQLLNMPLGAPDIALDILRLESGGEPSAARPTVRTVYLAVDAVLLALAGFVVIEFLRLLRRQRSGRRVARPRVHVASIALASGLLPVAILVGLPLAIGLAGSAPPFDPIAGWRFVLWTLPDIGLSLLLIALALLAIGSMKLLALRGIGQADNT